MNKYEPKYMQLQEKKIQNILNKKQTVTSVAKEICVTRQIVHRWVNRYKRFGIEGLMRKKAKKRTRRAHNRTPEFIEEYIKDLAYHNNFDGVETLADKLQYEYNIKIDSNTIYRILKRENVRYTNQQPATRKRWKKQLYTHKQAGLELQMDTKYLFGYKMGKVIYTIIDDASRWPFVWTYKTVNGDNTVDFLKKY